MFRGRRINTTCTANKLSVVAVRVCVAIWSPALVFVNNLSLTLLNTSGGMRAFVHLSHSLWVDCNTSSSARDDLAVDKATWTVA